MTHPCIGKDRRETGDFIGGEGVLKHLKDGPPRRRVGLVIEGAPARRESFSTIFLFSFNIVAQRERKFYLPQTKISVCYLSSPLTARPLLKLADFLKAP
jgi:glycine cleavage system aminomethyltransferase T